MDYSKVREPNPPFAPLGREPAEGEEFAIDEQGMVLIKIDGVLHPGFIKRNCFEDLQEKFTLTDSDIVITTYPKCGTTWMQQVVLLMLAGGDKEQIGDIIQQAPWLELKYAKGGGIDAVLNTKPALGDKKVWKTHAVHHQLPWKAGSKGKKIIVTRNPFDAAVSMYHHAHEKANFMYSGDWNHFLGLYSKGLVETGDFWAWHSEWYKCHQESSDTFWVCFEDMKDDLPKVVRDLAAFLDMELDDETVTKVAVGSGFDVMKKQFEELDSQKIAAGKAHMVKKNHIRKGESGAWKKAFTEAQEEEFRAVHLAKCKEHNLPLDLFKRC